MEVLIIYHKFCLGKQEASQNFLSSDGNCPSNSGQKKTKSVSDVSSGWRKNIEKLKGLESLCPFFFS